MNKPIKINIFVSCPQNSETLNNQKVALAKRCNELEEDFAKEDKDVDINTVIYSVPVNRKQIGEKNIKKADIAIFLFDDKQDDVLVNELKLAVDRSKKFREPELFVFFSKKAEENHDIDQIKQILVDGGWIPEPLTNTQKLLDNVKEKIHQYVRSQKSIQEIRRLSKKRYYGLRIAHVLFVLLIALLVLRPFLKDKFESRQLLIMGGGSAINYIVENSPNLNSKDDLNTIRRHYAAMASGNAYGLIAEEVIKNYDGYKSHPYYPIVLSAQRATENDFLKTSNNKDEFNNTGIVIGIFLGYDWLVAYGSKDAFPKPDSIIRVDLLNKIIVDQVLLLKSQLDSVVYDSIESNAIARIRPITIYTTSDNSGTLNSYKEICDSSIIQYNDFEHHIFSDIVTLSDKQGKEWIALGSNYYHPQDTSNIVSLTLHDSNDKVIPKPIYIYFMLYKQDEAYVLPRATKKFLKKINLPNTTIDSIDNPSIISSIINESTILYDTIFKFYKSQL